MTDVIEALAETDNAARNLALRVAELTAKLNEWHDSEGHFGAFRFCEHTVCKTITSWMGYGLSAQEMADE